MASTTVQVKVELSPKSKEICGDLKYIIQKLDHLEKELPWRINDLQRMRARCLRIIKNLNAKASKTP